MSYSPEAQYDDQGKYFFATCKIAGWDEKRVEYYLIKKYKKTHWNLLTAKEKKQMIAMMNKYAKPEREKRILTTEKGSEMYIIVSKYTKTIEIAREAFSSMVNFMKNKGIIPLLCQNERGFFVARALAKDEEYVSHSTWHYKNTKDPSITDTINIIEEL